MQYNNGKVEEAMLALLGVLEFKNRRAWKRFAFDVMVRYVRRATSRVRRTVINPPS